MRVFLHLARGGGLAVLAIALGVGALMEWITTMAFDETYYQIRGWPVLVAMLVSGGLCWLLANFLDRRSAKLSLKEEAVDGGPVLPRHHLLFIPVRWWGPILAMVGLGLFVVRTMKMSGAPQ